MSLDGGLAEAKAAAAPAERTIENKPAARIGDRLLDLGLITLDQLEVALFGQKRSGKMLGAILVDLGFISHAALTSVLAESSGYEQFDPATAMVDPDPVEYQLPLLRQTQVRESTGLGFAEGVRALPRQDPDIVFIGEVRDADTATMAVRAAMTGHQVFTTLHTNDALSAIPRLSELGLEPSMLAGNMTGVLAQRLARKLCPRCKAGRPAAAEDCRILGADPADPQIGAQPGCATATACIPSATASARSARPAR